MNDFKIFINLKTYRQGTGEKAVELAEVCEEVLRGVYTEQSECAQNDKKNIDIIPIVQVVDLFQIKKILLCRIPIWVQHVDQFEQGQYTGFTNLEAVIEAGASGTLINHSEHQLPPGTVKQIIARIRNSQFVNSKINNFQSMVCCKTLGQMEKLVKFKPDYIAYEIAELIGTKDSIVEKAPKAIKHAVEICGEIPLIVGAGVHTKSDLDIAKKLGAKGVLISSAVVLAENPKKKLEELL